MSAAPGLAGHLLAAAAAGAAVALVLPGSVASLAGRAGPVIGGDMDPAGGVSRDETDLFERYRWPLALLAGVVPVVVLGGALGAAAGVVAVVVAHRVLDARESATVRKRREEVERALPHVVDLLAVVLAAGAAPSRALSTVATAVEGPVVEDLRAAEHSLGLGRDPVRVWQELGRRPGLAALGRTMSRAVETGASVSGALGRLAEDLAASARLDAETRARAVGVRATAPLGVCLLPAFVLVGIVPLVVGTAGAFFNR